MTSAEIIDICYSSIIRHKGKYLKKAFAEDMGIGQAQMSDLFNGRRELGSQNAARLSAALAKHGIEVTPGHILDGLSQDNWELIPQPDAIRQIAQSVPEGCRVERTFTMPHDVAGMTDSEKRERVIGIVLRLEGEALDRAYMLCDAYFEGLTAGGSRKKNIGASS